MHLKTEVDHLSKIQVDQVLEKTEVDRDFKKSMLTRTQKMKLTTSQKINTQILVFKRWQVTYFVVLYY
jgi:hypothetical protein